METRLKQVESLLKAAGVLPQNYVDETILEDDAEDDLDVDDDYEQDDEGYWEGSTWFEGNPEALRALKEGTTAHSDVIGVGKKKNITNSDIANQTWDRGLGPVHGCRLSPVKANPVQMVVDIRRIPSSSRQTTEVILAISVSLP